MEKATLWSPKNYRKRVNRLFAWELVWALGAAACRGSHMTSTLCPLESPHISGFLSFPIPGTIVLELGKVGFWSHCLAGGGGNPRLTALEGTMFPETQWNPNSILPWHHGEVQLLLDSIEWSVWLMLSCFTPSEVLVVDCWLTPTVSVCWKCSLDHLNTEIFLTFVPFNGKARVTLSTWGWYRKCYCLTWIYDHFLSSLSTFDCTAGSHLWVGVALGWDF